VSFQLLIKDDYHHQSNLVLNSSSVGRKPNEKCLPGTNKFSIKTKVETELPEGY